MTSGQVTNSSTRPIPLLTRVQAAVYTKARRDIVLGRVWSVTQEQTPRYSILPDGEQSLYALVEDLDEDRLQVLGKQETQTIRLVKP